MVKIGGSGLVLALGLGCVALAVAGLGGCRGDDCVTGAAGAAGGRAPGAVDTAGGTGSTTGTGGAAGTTGTAPGAAGGTGDAAPPGVQGPPRQGACEVSRTLVPSCGAWWGVAPEIFTGRRPQRALERAERRMGRPAAIMHVYHRDDELFPTPAERAIARDPDGRRILLVNWKPSADLSHTWAEIAGGALDARIDRLAAHIVRTFPERFFLTVHHEPEDDVRETPGAGMSADDYAEMFRHVVGRLRAGGVTNAVTVMTYMGAPNWASEPWFERLYPGDDVVDWVAMDPYADHRADGFGELVDKTRPDFPRWPGFYRWTQERLPGKPVMVAEWGVFERRGRPAFKESFFTSVRDGLGDYPRIKALVYFDSPKAPRGDTRFDTTPGARRAFGELARDPRLSPAVPPR
ncbi:glycoside hydrolase family 26 protein [Streptosporangium sp. DT93]|uniref:glycoside hydrolase family 26 protein n=1 Tax=Streptosporangium sp. DT93 TaxID=3393428 RepID=UPI003CF5023B